MCSLQRTLDAIFPNDILFELFSFMNHYQMHYWIASVSRTKQLQTMLYKYLSTSIDNASTISLMENDNWDPTAQPFVHNLTSTDIHSILQKSSARCLQVFLDHKLVDPHVKYFETCTHPAIRIENLKIIIRFLDSNQSLSLPLWWHNFIMRSNDDTILEIGSQMTNPKYRFPKSKLDVECMRVVCNSYWGCVLDGINTMQHWNQRHKMIFFRNALTTKNGPQYDLISSMMENLRLDVVDKLDNRRELQCFDLFLEHFSKLSPRLQSFVQGSVDRLKTVHRADDINDIFGDCLRYGFVSLATWIWDHFEHQHAQFENDIQTLQNVRGLVEFVKADWPYIDFRKDPNLLLQIALQSGSEFVIRFICTNKLWEQHPQQWQWLVWRDMITKLKDHCVDHFWNLLPLQKMQGFARELIVLGHAGIRRANQFNLQVPRDLLKDYYLKHFVENQACNLIEQTQTIHVDGQTLRHMYQTAINLNSLQVVQCLWRVHPLVTASSLLANMCISKWTCDHSIPVFLLTTGAVSKYDLWNVCKNNREISTTLIRNVFAVIDFDIDDFI